MARELPNGGRGELDIGAALAYPDVLDEQARHPLCQLMVHRSCRASLASMVLRTGQIWIETNKIYDRLTRARLRTQKVTLQTITSFHFYFMITLEFGYAYISGSP